MILPIVSGLKETFLHKVQFRRTHALISGSTVSGHSTNSSPQANNLAKNIFLASQRLESTLSGLTAERFSPTLTTQLEEINNLFEKKVSITEEHPEREFIDIKSPAIGDLINTWINSFLDEATILYRSDTGYEMPKSTRRQLNKEIHTTFRDIIDQLNTRSILLDIQEGFKNINLFKINDRQYKQHKLELSQELAKKYPFSNTEAAKFIKLVQNEKGLWGTLRDLEKRYGIWKDNKVDITKTVSSYMGIEVVCKLIPQLTEEIKSGLGLDQEQFKNSLANRILSTPSMLIARMLYQPLREFAGESKTELLREFKAKANAEIAMAITQGKGVEMEPEKIVEILTQGVQAKGDLLLLLLSDLIPLGMGVGISVGAPLYRNPVFGAIGTANAVKVALNSSKANDDLTHLQQEEDLTSIQAKSLSTDILRNRDSMPKNELREKEIQLNQALRQADELEEDRRNIRGKSSLSTSIKSMAVGLVAGAATYVSNSLKGTDLSKLEPTNLVETLTNGPDIDDSLGLGVKTTQAVFDAGRDTYQLMAKVDRDIPRLLYRIRRANLLLDRLLPPKI